MMMWTSPLAVFVPLPLLLLILILHVSGAVNEEGKLATGRLRSPRTGFPPASSTLLPSCGHHNSIFFPHTGTLTARVGHGTAERVGWFLIPDCVAAYPGL